MLIWESITIALHELFANKLRSILIMLGIIIGVAAVIAMVSIGMGVKSNVEDSMASLGSNMLIVTPGAANSGGIRGAAGSRESLKYDDAVAIKKKIKNIDHVSPIVQRSYQIVYGNQNWNTVVMGVTPEYMSIRSLTLTVGTFISQTTTSASASPSSARPSLGISSAARTPSAGTFASTTSRSRSSAFSRARDNPPWAKIRTMWSSCR